MTDTTIHTIDLHFLGRARTIAAYLVPHSAGGILIEAGPHSTISNLVVGLKTYGYEIEDLTDVFLTHVHLDHAGGAGWLAQHGCHIHVHENGAPHLINPEKLLASAGRLYSGRMDTLWGDFIPVKEDKIKIMHDNEVIKIGDQSIRALDVPGHANHHLVYLIGDACFIGDIGGIRLNPHKYLSLPMPPPDFHLEKWLESIKYIQKFDPTRIIPTHFGIYSDARWHLQAVLEELYEVEAWIEARLPLNPSLEDFRQQFIEFEQFLAQKNNVEKAIVEAQQIANPSFLSADGIFRYWNKYRNPA
jgi:glyoxylase-like metal-dependent hydrolase (beta-lactamase superfamily II)